MEEIKNYVSFDLEFNEVEGVQHLLQVSAVKYLNHEEVDRFDTYVHTTEHIKSFVTGLTGITIDKIKDAPPVDKVLEEFKNFVGDFPLMGYNGRKSDIPVLQSHGLDLEAQYLIDVYEIAQEMKPTYLSGSKGLSLKAVAEYIGLNGQAHNCLEDSIMTAKVYQGLLELKANESYLDEQEEVANNPFASLGLAGLFGEAED